MNVRLQPWLVSGAKIFLASLIAGPLFGYIAGIVLQDRIANTPAILSLQAAQAASDRERTETIGELRGIRILMENWITEQRRTQDRIDRILLQRR
jgi:hypothetical protein